MSTFCLPDQEKVDEISHRRNRAEKKLRMLLKNALKQSFGKKIAMEKVLKAIPSERRKNLENNDIDTILNRDESPLFFLDLKNIIKREWNSFMNIFELEKNKVMIILDDINSSGRPDAHAKSIKTDDFKQLRLHFNKLETIF